MSVRRDVELDLVLGPWLEDVAAPRAVDYLGEALERTRRTRQRPGWSFPRRWLPVLGELGAPVVPRAAWALLVLGLLIALVVGVLAVGGLRRLPAPYGFAKPGLVAFDAGHDIVVMNPDGTERRQLTTGGDADTSPVWSPDGTLLAFWRATGNGRWTIVVADAAGSVRASIGVQAATELPFPEHDTRWATLDYALGSPSFLTWSPDSRRIAFSQPTHGVSGVWVVDADGGGLRQLGDPGLPAADPYWSADGTRIAFHGGTAARADNGVWVMGADGTGARRVTHVQAGDYSFYYPQWQLGGELIAFHANPQDEMHIWVVRSDGTGERDISLPYVPYSNDWIPRWSPDGSRIAFQRISVSRPGGDIVIADPDGTHVVRPIDREYGSIGGPMWAPDGRTVSALMYASTGSVGLLDLDPSGVRPPVVVPAADNDGGTSWQRLAP